MNFTVTESVWMCWTALPDDLEFSSVSDLSGRGIEEDISVWQQCVKGRRSLGGE